MMRRRKRWIAFAGAALLACTFAGAVVASQLGDPPPSPQQLGEAIKNAPMVSVAEIPSANGEAARGAFAQFTSTGQFCLWDAPSATSQQRLGGCNPADDPLGGHPLSASLAYEGGPGAGRVVDARLIGLVSAEVASVQVLMKDGSRRAVKLRPVPQSIGDFRAFGYRFKPKDVRSGGPTAVLALDAQGSEIDRQTTGF
jgi:hypothetical protein